MTVSSRGLASPRNQSAWRRSPIRPPRADRRPEGTWLAGIDGPGETWREPYHEAPGRSKVSSGVGKAGQAGQEGGPADRGDAARTGRPERAYVRMLSYAARRGMRGCAAAGAGFEVAKGPPMTEPSASATSARSLRRGIWPMRDVRAPRRVSPGGGFRPGLPFADPEDPNGRRVKRLMVFMPGIPRCFAKM